MKQLLFPILLLLSFPIFSQEDLSSLSFDELDSLVDIAYQKGTYDKAIPYLEAGRAKAKKEQGELSLDFASYTNNLAFFYEKIGLYSKALPLHLQAINIEKKILPPNDPELAISLNNLAALYQSMGKYEEALSIFIEAKNIFEKALGATHPDFATALNNIAHTYNELGNDELSLQLYLQAKNIREKALGTKHPLFTESLNNLANFYKTQGKYELALPLFIQAVDIEKETLGTTHPDFAVSLNNLASLYQLMGQNEQALSLYIQAKNIREKILGAEHPRFASSLNNIASLYQKMGRNEQALPLFMQAKNIYEKALGINHLSVANIWNSLSTLYHSLGNDELCWQALQQSLKITSGLEISTTISPAWADSLLHAQYASNNYLEFMNNPLQSAYILLKTDSSSKSSSLASFRTSQIIIADLATALLAKLRNKYSNDSDKLRTLAKSNEWLIWGLKALYHLQNKEKDASKAFELADQNKSVLLLQVTKSEQAYQLGDLPDSLVLQDKKLTQQRDKLEANILEKRSNQEKDSLRAVLIKTNQEIETFKSFIEKKYPKYAALKYQQTTTKVQDIQKRLNKNTAIIEYALGNSAAYIFYIDQNNLHWVKQKLEPQELAEKTKAFHQILSNYSLISDKTNESYQKYTELAFWFYKNLIAPVLDGNNKSIQHLIIIPDGELAHLPFETFLVKQAPQTETSYNQLHYLLKDYNISYNYSAALWKENFESPTPKNNGQILAMAANYEIKFDTASNAVRLTNEQLVRAALQPLPAARKEVEALQKEFNGFFAFDQNASEKMIKEKAGDYAVIHLAMHGLLDSKRPVLSSLAFTENSDSSENNFWQAHEISKIKLNANLVVLSACETGYGKFEKGNGVASLARAFMYAGASSLIVSLWQVSDYATSEIMKKLYQNLANGMTKDQALRQAKLDYIQEAKGIAAHPAFWSPFIQIGNTDAISLETQNNSKWWIIGGIFIVLVGIGFGVLRKRTIA